MALEEWKPGDAMTTERATRHVDNFEGQLERAFIREVLFAQGLDENALRELPEFEAKRVLTQASIYAADKLAEIEARARFVHEIHGHYC
jgi:hypothetical protein